MLQKNFIKIKYDLEVESKQIDKYEEPLNYKHCCPCCGSYDIVRNGKFSRNIVYLKGKQIKTKTIILQRFLCKKCNKSSTYYPEFIIPRREYSRFFTAYILLSDVGIRMLSASISIPLSQVRRLRKDLSFDAVKLKHLIEQTGEIVLSKLISLYEYTFSLKVFHPYQRDLSLMHIP
ncbi:MAG: DUF6431 domain-containing protein [Bacteroidales bacterium]|nr:DUF6431 domain-containing protein [Bacteroidales bacterium]